MITKYKIFEGGIWSKNLVIGGIYEIEDMIISEYWRKNIPIGKIIDFPYEETSGKYVVEIKTFISGTNQEHILELERRFIKKKATPEQIKLFNRIETRSKVKNYNLSFMNESKYENDSYVILPITEINFIEKHILISPCVKVLSYDDNFYYLEATEVNGNKFRFNSAPTGIEREATPKEVDDYKRLIYLKKNSLL